LKQNKINKEMPYYSNIHNIYLYQYHDTKPNPINVDWLLGLTPTHPPSPPSKRPTTTLRQPKCLYSRYSHQRGTTQQNEGGDKSCHNIIIGKKTCTTSKCRKK